MERLLVRPREAAEMLGVSRSRAYVLLARGEIPGVVRIGKSVRISIDALRRWVREQAEMSEQSGTPGQAGRT